MKCWNEGCARVRRETEHDERRTSEDYRTVGNREWIIGRFLGLLRLIPSENPLSSGMCPDIHSRVSENPLSSDRHSRGHGRPLAHLFRTLRQSILAVAACCRRRGLKLALRDERIDARPNLDDRKPRAFCKFTRPQLAVALEGRHD